MIAPLDVMASMAFKEAYLALAPAFEEARGAKVATRFVGSAEIMKRLRAGEGCDLVVMSAGSIDELAGEGIVARGSRVDLARSSVAAAVRAGEAKPDLGSAQALKRALLAARRVGYSSGPSGVYLAKLFKDWGISPDRLLQTPPGAPVGEALVRGEADIGFQQLSELLPVQGIDIAGPLPAEIQLVTVFSAGTHARSAQAGAARAFTDFLTSPAAAPVIRQKGLDPVQ